MYDVREISNTMDSDVEDEMVVMEFDKIKDGTILTCACGYTKSTSGNRQCSYCKTLISKDNTERFVNSASMGGK